MNGAEPLLEGNGKERVAPGSALSQDSSIPDPPMGSSAVSGMNASKYCMSHIALFISRNIKNAINTKVPEPVPMDYEADFQGFNAYKRRIHH